MKTNDSKGSGGRMVGVLIILTIGLAVSLLEFIVLESGRDDLCKRSNLDIRSRATYCARPNLLR